MQNIFKSNKKMDEKQPSAPWIRLERVIRWANKTPNAFARHIGLARGENLYQIKRGNNGISLKLAERIVQCFPEIDRLWLLTGEGEMLREAEQRVVAIPFYEVDLAEGLPRLSELTPACSLFVPPVGECDLAICYRGEEMAPSIPAGTILLLKKIDKEALIEGATYAIVTKNFVTLRNVHAGACRAELLLGRSVEVSGDEERITMGEIEAIYAVRGRLMCNN